MKEKTKNTNTKMEVAKNKKVSQLMTTIKVGLSSPQA
jgi:hypothetical protein